MMLKYRRIRKSDTPNKDGHNDIVRTSGQNRHEVNKFVTEKFANIKIEFNGQKMSFYDFRMIDNMMTKVKRGDFVIEII